MRLEWLATVALISACGTPSSMDSGVDAGVTDAGMISGDAGTPTGTFQILHTVSQFGDSSSFFGKVFDGPTPITTIFSVDVSDGDCRVETPRVPFCATPCGGSAACVEDDVCQAYPTSRSSGTVQVTGLLVGGTSTPVELSAINNGYQVPAAVTLSIPPFADGAAISLNAAGSSAVPAFSLSSQGVAPIALMATTYNLQSGTALDLQWTAGNASTAARIEVEIDISHHGGLRGQILCDTADDGSVSIGGALVTRLINLGVSGFPTITVRRVKKSSLGKVDFKVVSSTELGLTIPGLTSCTDDAECPTGQTCQNDLRCQ